VILLQKDLVDGRLVQRYKEDLKIGSYSQLNKAIVVFFPYLEIDD
jgi:hypothetical protein